MSRSLCCVRAGLALAVARAVARASALVVARVLALFLASVLALASALPTTAHAHGNPSHGSELSLLPVAVSVAAPVALLSAGAVFTVVAVQASAVGTVWVLERASDGAQASVQFGSQVVGGASVLAGTAVVATVFSAGTVLSAAGRAIAFIPNEVGKALLYNERVTR